MSSWHTIATPDVARPSAIYSMLHMRNTVTNEDGDAVEGSQWIRQLTISGRGGGGMCQFKGMSCMASHADFQTAQTSAHGWAIQWLLFLVVPHIQKKRGGGSDWEGRQWSLTSTTPTQTRVAWTTSCDSSCSNHGLWEGITWPCQGSVVHLHNAYA